MDNHIFKNVIHLEPSDIDGQSMTISGMTGINGFIAVYAPWCGHCKSLQPTWQTLSGETQKSFLAINATDNDNGGKQLAGILKVPGYPTILEFMNGKIKGPYQGQSRSEINLRERFAKLK